MKRAVYSLLFLSLAGAVATVPVCAQTLYNNFTQYSDTAVPYVAYGVFGYPYEVTDSFELGSNSSVAGANLILWAYADSSTPQTGWDINWSIGTTQYGNDVATGTDATPTSNYINTEYDSSVHNSSYLFNLYSVTIPIPDVALSGGAEYWLTLSNTTNTQEGDAYWDASDGPSTAYSPAYGKIPSETFELFGADGPTPVPEASPFDLPVVIGALGMVLLLSRKRIVALGDRRTS